MGKINGLQGMGSRILSLSGTLNLFSTGRPKLSTVKNKTKIPRLTLMSTLRTSNTPGRSEIQVFSVHKRRWSIRNKYRHVVAITL